MALRMTLLPVATILITWTATSLGSPLEIYDLTHEIGQDPMSWPLFPKFNFTIQMRGRQPAGYWLESNTFEMAEHSGTHMDAPSHFTEGGLRVHQIPASRLIGPGVVIDVTEKVASNPEYLVSEGDLQEWEQNHGRIPDGAVILMRSGWSSRYPERQRILNTRNIMDINSFRFPGFKVDAAQWLASHRNITAVGVDTPSPDNRLNYGDGKGYPVHTTLLPKGILILENVRMTADVPPSGTIVIVGVINLSEGSGSPMRLFAVRNGLWSRGVSSSTRPSHLMAFFMLLLVWRTPSLGC
ncbi:uncharacterized protein LOC112571038 [Pomacea canaliculata]|uniref:uncharacterized protein LOC112571038 n=1 Tax=Pomacea canaliculata TaxID=400727 RepID=UPI000D735C61|nr:uncharacterized protein LOC112571038 [Pomacea canaliculata]